MLGPVKDGTLGESNTRLTARLRDKDEANAERKGLGHMLARIAAEADEFERRTARKGVCSKCHYEIPCGVNRKQHECW